MQCGALMLSSLIKQAYTHYSFKRIWRRVKDDKQYCCKQRKSTAACAKASREEGLEILFRSAELSWTIASPFSSFSKLLRLLEANIILQAEHCRQTRQREKISYNLRTSSCNNLKRNFIFYNSFFFHFVLRRVRNCTRVFLLFKISHDHSYLRAG